MRQIVIVARGPPVPIAVAGMGQAAAADPEPANTVGFGEGRLRGLAAVTLIARGLHYHLTIPQFGDRGEPIGLELLGHLVELAI